MSKRKWIVVLISCFILILASVVFYTNGLALKTGSNYLKINSKNASLYPASKINVDKKLWGYINSKGKFIISPQYDGAEDFDENGLAIVYKNDLYGLIDKNRKNITPLEYKFLNYNGEGVYLAKKNNQDGILNSKGKFIPTKFPIYSKFVSGLAIYTADSKTEKDLYGFLNKEGKVIIEAKYKYALPFMGNNAIVRIADNQYALIDTKGNVVRSINSTDVKFASDDILTVYDSQTKKEHYERLDGTIINLQKAQSSSLSEFSGDYAAINYTDYSDTKHYLEGEKYGAVDKSGKLIIKPVYNSIQYLGQNLFAVSEPGKNYPSYTPSKKAIIDLNGNRLTNYKYYDVGIYKQNLISVTDDKYTYFLDINGHEVKGMPKLLGAGTVEIKGELIKAYVDNKLSYYTRDGKVVWKEEDISKDIKLSDGVIKTIRYRPNIFTDLSYPQIEGMKDSYVQNKINSKLKLIFYVDVHGKAEEQGSEYSMEQNGGFNAKQAEDLIEVTSYYEFYGFGAAHGDSSAINYHLDMKTGEEYNIFDLINKDNESKQAFLKAVNSKLDLKVKNGELSSYVERLTEVKDDLNFEIGENDISVNFNTYEIASRAEGFIQVTIPYSEIMQIIDKDSGVWKCIKDYVKISSEKDKSSDNHIDEINQLFVKYESAIVDAINNNDFKIVESCLLENSSMYNDQVNLVKNLNRQDIKEKLERFRVVKIDEGQTQDEYKVLVDETVGISNKGNKYIDRNFRWTYTVVFSDGKYKISKIEKGQE